MPSSSDVHNQLKSIEALVRQIEKADDPTLTSTAKQLVRSLMEFHGAALERMLEIIYQSEGSGVAIIDALGRDDVSRSVLLLYGLHPETLEARVLQALEKSRPYLKSHGGDMNLARVDDSGVVTLRFESAHGGCSSSSTSLRQRVEEAIYDAAPDVAAIIIEGLPTENSPGFAFVPLSQLGGAVPESKPEFESKVLRS